MKEEQARDRIIEATIELINENAGDINKVTARLIAYHAGISLGLINYHFGNKNNLILECTQKIINQVVMTFDPQIDEDKTKGVEAGRIRLTKTAQQVFDFLFKNRAISKISIIGDMQECESDSNTVHTQMGFMHVIGDIISNENKRLISFLLTSSMQSAFLAAEVSNGFMGYDLTKEGQRDKFIADTVNTLFYGIVKEND